MCKRILYGVSLWPAGEQAFFMGLFGTLEENYYLCKQISLKNNLY